MAKPSDKAALGFLLVSIVSVQRANLQWPWQRRRGEERVPSDVSFMMFLYPLTLFTLLLVFSP